MQTEQPKYRPWGRKGRTLKSVRPTELESKHGGQITQSLVDHMTGFHLHLKNNTKLQNHVKQWGDMIPFAFSKDHFVFEWRTYWKGDLSLEDWSSWASEGEEKWRIPDFPGPNIEMS